MYPIGSYAVPQIQSVNPDINIDSFVMPASEDASVNKLNSGNDLQFSVMAESEHKEAAYEVLDFLLEDRMYSSIWMTRTQFPVRRGILNWRLCWTV